VQLLNCDRPVIIYSARAGQIELSYVDVYDPADGVIVEFKNLWEVSRSHATGMNT